MIKLRYLIPFVLLTALPVQAAERNDLQDRVQRLERLMESQSLMEMLTRIDRQQRELALVRGELEEVSHELESLKKRQRDLYLDTDRRLSRLEREGIPTAGVDARSQVGPDSETGTGAAKPEQGVKGPSTAELAAERQAYQEAFDILRELRYEQAIDAFENFLEQHPDGRYAHIAQYWLGEASYARRDFDKAITAYRALVDNHAKSPKVAEALLKIGYSYHELEQDGKARPVLEQLVNGYPGTTEADQAQNLLKRLGKQGG
ncbi:tol-pal system protein YbgF [Thiohalomonas denitrificans]|uniref:Cell division coordinator CpoB n=1 Tax=Thiohalomonas denitrificans TaxID=415747 RepID=A0A1G5PKM4_9GAMM|nr:tol-pal system protein YbgF [Thiohalomonas denitrificans]SCZ50085.1 tol-pal system protein YbgF [Thiohalomonas denitrificans]